MPKRSQYKTQMLDTEITVLLDTFRRLVRRKAKTNLKKLLQKTHPADLAQLFRYFTHLERSNLFDLMDREEHTGEFLTELDSSIAEEIMEPLDASEIANLLHFLSSDDAADLLNILSKEKSGEVLELFKREESEEVEELMAYDADTAGGIMTVEVFSLPETTKVSDAIAAIQTSEEVEMVFYLYVTDGDNKLTGVISLRELVTVQPDSDLRSIMFKDVVSVTPEMDQEEVARKVSQYNLLAIPVVDVNNTLLGFVTVDDVVDVIREEATEDFLQMAGVGKDREILMKSTWGNARLRLPWLFATFLGGIFVSWMTGYFEPVLMSTVALPAFIPVIIGMGGNVGTQSSTIIIRGIATGRVQLGHVWSIIFREIRVGLLLGIFYGFLLGIVASLGIVDTPPRIGIVVGLSICSSMLIATSLGTTVPIFLRKLDVDPAVASGPFVTTATDVLGILFYFIIAGSLLTTI